MSAIDEIVNYSKRLHDLKRYEVAVGLPKEKATAEVYKNGMTVDEIGAIHEYGLGVPRRSWNKATFLKRKKEVATFNQAIFKKMLKSKLTAKAMLELIGTNAVNQILDAFQTGGFGAWKADSEETVKRKGSSKILIDSGILKNSITYVLRRSKN